MKVEQINPEPKFKPVVITLETQDEVDALVTITNYSPISRALPCTKNWYKELDGYGNYTGLWGKFITEMR